MKDKYCLFGSSRWISGRERFDCPSDGVQPARHPTAQRSFRHAQVVRRFSHRVGWRQPKIAGHPHSFESPFLSSQTLSVHGVSWHNQKLATRGLPSFPDCNQRLNPIRVPCERRFRLAPEPRAINRRASPRPVPTTLHALAQYMLLVLLRRQGVEALAELTVRFTPTQFLIPDVIAAPCSKAPTRPIPFSSASKFFLPKTASAPCSPSASSITPGASHSAGSSIPKNKPPGNIIPAGDPERVESRRHAHGGRTQRPLAELFATTR